MASALVKSLSRLSRTQLVDLALHWLNTPSTCAPYLASNRTMTESDEEDYLFPPARSVRELRSIYKNLRLDEDNSSKSYVVDRIVDGDWRRGLSLYQHATIDFAHLATHDTAFRWTALRIVPLEHDISATGEPPTKKRKHVHTQPIYPTISPTTFAHTLRAQVAPLAKAHYQITTLPAPYALPILRLYLPPNKPFAPHQANIPHAARSATDGGRTIYIALPPSSPHIYISVSGASASTAKPNTAAQAKIRLDITNLKRLIIEAIPKALSRRHERWALESTKLTTRSLRSICALRGCNERPGTAGGAFSAFFASDKPAKTDHGTDESISETTKLEPSPADVLGRNGSKTQTDAEQDPSQKPASQSAPDKKHPMFFTGPHTLNPTSGIEHQHQQHQAPLIRRFGPINQPHGVKLDRLTARITDLLQPTPSTAKSRDDDTTMDLRRDAIDCAPISISFGGTNVVLGLRMLAALRRSQQETTAAGEEAHGGPGKALDLVRMPGWMTGEQGRSYVVV